MASRSTSHDSPRPDFIFIAEDPALDFANTLLVCDGRLQDLLASWPEVVRWIAQAKLSSGASLDLPAAARREALQLVIEFRRAWARTLAQLVDGKAVSDAFLRRINTLLAHDKFQESLHREGKQGFHLARQSTPRPGDKRVLSILARQVAGFLASAHLEHLHRCANTDSCVLYFYDTTKNHRRQWCSVATCGNRHKVAQFRQRQARTRK